MLKLRHVVPTFRICIGTKNFKKYRYTYLIYVLPKQIYWLSFFLFFLQLYTHFFSVLNHLFPNDSFIKQHSAKQSNQVQLFESNSPSVSVLEWERVRVFKFTATTDASTFGCSLGSFFDISSVCPFNICLRFYYYTIHWY